MTKPPTITGTLEWRKVDPDGSDCYRCGDRIWLVQFSAVMIIGIREHKLPICLCQSCADLLQP